MNANATGGIEATKKRSFQNLPSKAGRNDDSERHGIFDFFLVTIGSFSDLVCNMRVSKTAGRPRATPPTADWRVNVPCPS